LTPEHRRQSRNVEFKVGAVLTLVVALTPTSETANLRPRTTAPLLADMSSYDILDFLLSL
jgi:hypothetical protein